MIGDDGDDGPHLDDIKNKKSNEVLSLSLCIAIFENLFDKSVGLSGRKTIMEAWNAQYAMCLAYFDSHCF